MNQVATINTNAEQNLPATLDRAQAAIALASKPEEINQVLAMMGAAVEYAKRLYKGQNDVIQRAKSLQIQAERKLGEILRDMPKATGAAGIGPIAVPNGNRNTTPTLADIGIDKKTSARAQKLAALPEDTFADVAAGKITVAAAIAPAPKPEKEVVITEEDDAYDPSKDEEDYAEMLKASDKENDTLLRINKSLMSNDDKVEIENLHRLLNQKDGAINGKNNTIAEAQKLAKYQGDLLEKIRAALGVATNKEILPKLAAL